jgi:two-component system CheB/CheR fusion protein
VQHDLEASRYELATTYEELQSANEELETTNEELQSTIEELETTNEELQSTNEELETMNEELQSTNEELEQVNTSMAEQARELDRANEFLQSILASIKSGVVVLNRNLEVQVWNGRAEDQWGLRQAEVRGHHFLGLDIGLPVAGLAQSLRDCLADEDGAVELDLEMRATNRRGRPVDCRIRCMSLTSDGSGVGGVIMLIDDTPVPHTEDGQGVE